MSAGNSAQVMERMAAQSRALGSTFNAQQRSIDGSSAAMLRYNARLAEARAAQMRMLRFGAGIGAVALGAITVSGISDAARLEKAMTGVSIATGITADKFRDLRRAQLSQVMQVSGQTAQSAVTIAEEMSMAARSGLNNPKQLQSAFKQIALLADVQWMAQQQNPVETTKLATQFAHYFNAYSGTKLQNMLDDVNRLMFMMPENMNRLVMQGRYFIPNAIALGIDEKTIMAQLAIMGTTGFLAGKGGTSLNNVILNALGAAALNPHLTRKKIEGGDTLRLLDAHGQLKTAFLKQGGAFDLDKMMQQISAMRVAMQIADPVRGISSWQTAVGNFLGKEGQRIVSVEANPDVQKRIAQNKITMSQIGGVQATWEQYNKDFFLSFNRFVTNFRNVGTMIFLPMLPTLTKFFNSLADSLSNLAGVLTAHPLLAKTISYGAIGMTTVLAGAALSGVAGFLGRSLGLGGGVAALRGVAGVAGRGGMMRALGEGLGAVATFAPIRAAIGKAFAFSPGGRGFIGQGVAAITKPDVLRDMAAGLRGLPGVRQMLTVFDNLGGASKFSAAAMNVVVRLFGFGIGNLAKLGLRAIPFVGDLLLIGDAFNFFRSHPKQIGEWIARIVFYLKTLVPQTIATMQSWVPIILGAFGKMFAGIWDMLIHPGRIYGAYQEAHRAYNNFMWTQQHALDVVTARAVAAHAGDNERRYLESQRRQGFDSDRRRRTYGETTSVHLTIQHANFPSVKRGEDIHPALMPWIVKSLPTNHTSPSVPFPFSVSLGAHA